MGKVLDLTGQRFGRLVVVSYHHTKDVAYWLCQCDCGNTSIVKGTSLRYGSTKSCGCGSLEQARINCEKHRTKHGMSHTRLNECWKNMKRRCYSVQNKRYANYGGRGIAVCEEWQNDFQAFYNWAMANGYHENLTLDRIDNDGNYEPKNCRWASQQEQQNNTSRNRFVSYNGETHTLAEWSRITGINPSTIAYRLKTHMPVEEALTKEVRKWK